MPISPNSKPTLYRNLYENTGLEEDVMFIFNTVIQYVSFLESITVYCGTCIIENMKSHSFNFVFICAWYSSLKAEPLIFVF